MPAPVPFTLMKCGASVDGVWDCRPALVWAACGLYKEGAFRLLVRAEANTFMTAEQAHEVKLIGDHALLMWFMGVGKYLKPGRRRQKYSAHEVAA